MLYNSIVRALYNIQPCFHLQIGLILNLNLNDNHYIFNHNNTNILNHDHNNNNLNHNLNQNLNQNLLTIFITELKKKMVIKHTRLLLGQS